MEEGAWLGRHWQLLVLPALLKKVLTGSFPCFEEAKGAMGILCTGEDEKVTEGGRSQRDLGRRPGLRRVG